jgi:hypothetical protein
MDTIGSLADLISDLAEDAERNLPQWEHQTVPEFLHALAEMVSGFGKVELPPELVEQVGEVQSHDRIIPIRLMAFALEYSALHK